MSVRVQWAWLLVASCGGPAGNETSRGFEGPPYAIITTPEHLLEVSVRFQPEASPTRGVNTLELQVHDGSGNARATQDVTLLPWMPAMNHGSSVGPVVSAAGEGRYLVDNVSMFMPGHWQLRFTLGDPASDAVDHGTLDVDIP